MPSSRGGAKNLTWLMPPTITQTNRINKLVIQLAELNKDSTFPHQPINRWEARDLIYKLRKRRDTDGEMGHHE